MYSIPAELVTEGMAGSLTLVRAAELLAGGGFAVLPLTSEPTKRRPKVDASKNAGAVLGKGWQHKTSTDPETLTAWFTPAPTSTAKLGDAEKLPPDWYRPVPFSTLGIGVHVGPDVVVADIDSPELVPAEMWQYLDKVPFQSSSGTDAKRGHYYFGLPDSGEFFFGQTSAIRGGAGELRHGNSIVVSAPSAHSKRGLGRRYRWVRGGIVESMPLAVAAWLQSERKVATWNGGELTVCEASWADIEEIRETFTTASNPEILAEHVDHLARMCDDHGLHAGLLPPLIDLIQMAVCGFVAAADALDAAEALFVGMAVTPRSGPGWTGNIRTEEQARGEFWDALKWAAGRVEAKLAVSADWVRYETSEFVGDIYGVAVSPLPKPEGWVGETSSEVDEWPPLDPFRAPPPPLPLDGLPSVLRSLVTEAAEALQVSTDLVLNHALGALSSAPYGTVKCRVRPGWEVPLNLAVMTLAKSGELKSPTNALVMRPFDQLETERRERDHDTALDRAGEIEALTAKLESAKRALKTVPTATTPASGSHFASVAATGSGYIEVAALQREIVRLKGKHLRWSAILDDATPEVVGVRLASTYTGATLMRSDETNIFSHIAGQAHNGGGTEKAKVYLMGISGDPIRTDRLSRDEVYVDNPSLSLALMMQPEVFESTLRNSPLLVDIGIVPRFLIVRPASKVGSRKADPPPVSNTTEHGWHTAVHGIATAAEAHVNRVLRNRAVEAAAKGTTVPVRQVEPRIIVIDAAGWELLRAYKDRIEPELGKNGRLEAVRAWGGKSTAYIAQIAALFTLMDDPVATVVDNVYIAVAEKLIDGYALHQLAVAEVPTEAAAEAVWARLGDLDDAKFDADGYLKLTAVRKLIQNQTWFKNAELRNRDELLRHALDSLESRGYIKTEVGKRQDSLKIRRRPDCA
ncbi:DUF3987 domain-containing protein [Antrihabitans stalactiti]|uniref:DUF3987 domain-containing protein n=1 Tax=Antrihabitans stalactiti TaxID=2584121 RepID=A0A848K7P4_9NOCA|nr:DUF3987 domain-containing protein [Antrihabitans stalactiti]NMN94823.1 DUF3987 domain-containing protein [Antrihabitans stalactiti]